MSDPGRGRIKYIRKSSCHQMSINLLGRQDKHIQDNNYKITINLKKSLLHKIHIFTSCKRYRSKYTHACTHLYNHITKSG